MRWTAPRFVLGKVDWAGDVLVARPARPWREIDRALMIIGNWRAAHHYPLNTFQVTLRRQAHSVNARSIVSQRIKRLSSIATKLRMFKRVPRLSTVKLSQMQDIGGCRAVLRSRTAVYRLVQLYLDSNLRHDLVDHDDYIVEPKPSGYRGYHLIYEYKSDREQSQSWNGLKIELQFRSPLQHAWATAVETVGTFTRQALKSSQGDLQWRRFFSLMGGVMALREKTAPIPGVPTSDIELVGELRELATELNVVNRLRHYVATIQRINPRHRRARYFLLVLDSNAQQVRISAYTSAERTKAHADYFAIERETQGSHSTDAVLVSVDTFTALQRAYPNYFLDTRVFIEAVQEAINAPLGRSRRSATNASGGE